MRLRIKKNGNDLDIRYKSDLIAWIQYSGSIMVTVHSYRHPLAPLYDRHRLITSESKSYDNRKIVLTLFISLVLI